MADITVKLTEEEAASAVIALAGYTLDAPDDGEEDEPRIIAANTARNKIIEAEKNADRERTIASAERKARRITSSLYKTNRYKERPRGGDGRLWVATPNENRTILTRDHPDYQRWVISAEDLIFSKVVVSQHHHPTRQYKGLQAALQCEIFDKLEG